MSTSLTMEYKGFKAQIMEAERLTGDFVHALPPGHPLPVYHSEAFKKYPESWMKGPGVFVVPVQPNKGLWFDWTMNDRINTAILPTVRGCNPITGMQTSGFHLERYEEKCPKHGVAFEGERYCPKCDYRWPPQNYVAAPNTLWWDTWYANGIGRQFFFTEEEMRDIASKLIGKENTVPAFGFAFYRPKEMRPEPTVARSRGIVYEDNGLYERCFSSSDTAFFDSKTYGSSKNLMDSHNIFYTNSVSQNLDMPVTMDGTGGSTKCSATPTSGLSVGMNASDAEIHLDNAASPARDILRSAECNRSKTKFTAQVAPKKVVKEVSVGAGANIDQALAPDPYELDSWKDKPEASMTIYFVFHEKLEELKAGGMKDLEGTEEGMLEGLPVG